MAAVEEIVTTVLEPSPPVPASDVPVAVKPSKVKKVSKELKTKKPRAPSAHPPYLEVFRFFFNVHSKLGM